MPKTLQHRPQPAASPVFHSYGPCAASGCGEGHHIRRYSRVPATRPGCRAGSRANWGHATCSLDLLVLSADEDRSIANSPACHFISLVPASHQHSPELAEFPATDLPPFSTTTTPTVRLCVRRVEGFDTELVWREFVISFPPLFSYRVFEPQCSILVIVPLKTSRADQLTPSVLILYPQRSECTCDNLLLSLASRLNRSSGVKDKLFPRRPDKTPPSSTCPSLPSESWEIRDYLFSTASSDRHQERPLVPRFDLSVRCPNSRPRPQLFRPEQFSREVYFLSVLRGDYLLLGWIVR